MKSINFVAEMKALASIGHCPALVNDDDGRWAVVSDGIQNLVAGEAADVHTTFWIEKDKWRNSPEAALEAYLLECFNATTEEQFNDEPRRRFVHNRDVFIGNPDAEYDYENVLI